MKYLIVLLLFIPSVAKAECLNYIATSEISKAISLQSNAGSKLCGGDDPCVCFDGIIWEIARYQDGVLSNDESRLVPLQRKSPRRAMLARKNLKAFKLQRKHQAVPAAVPVTETKIDPSPRQEAKASLQEPPVKKDGK